MKSKKQNIFLTLLSLLSLGLTAQTINTGDLYITEGTIMSSVGAVDNKSSGNLFNDGDFFVYSHYNNDGLVTFSTGSTKGITRMRGLSGSQEISGSAPIEWYNAEFKNSNVQPAFYLSNEVNIFGKADFQKGIVDDDNYGGLLVFEKGAEATNVSDNSFVDGKVQKNGKDAFIYPIGDKNKYRFAGISAPQEILSSFTAKYFYENSNVLYPHNDKAEGIQIINNQEYWTLDKTAGNSDVMLTLSWDETSTTPADILVSPQSEIHIVRWDASKKLWIDEGGIVDSDKKTVTTPINVSGYNVFTTARVDGGIILACSTLIVHNAVSPNGDNKNDYFKIDGLSECSTDNTVEIYNRWGVKVFETNNYDSNGNVFKGFSEGRVTISGDRLLPTGTYFYILNIKYSGTKSQTIKKAGYLYLSRD
ncbi:gliding motility-associated C-terminal domain-containing protein [Flavobacterium sp. AC]|uniref:Gliding motility-associated C-terminal domain-containing protein n=1 Tax=Flavobacterium azizsancarii TaxID=2961580 RepID=A0ABT4WJS4_9FLAO|nr:gliding motility-associated C-terminal domain-containing protein [Flavobacterium azizsancarii]MDA6072748.1 gliding motility-associated C-terminal domain-containing protein [Flavobacterium azizsancarii]